MTLINNANGKLFVYRINKSIAYNRIINSFKIIFISITEFIERRYSYLSQKHNNFNLSYFI